MKITIIGASRGTGLATAKEALARGHEVAGIARNPADMKHPKLTWFAGDARDANVLAHALAGADASVVALSVRDPWNPTTLFSEAQAALLDANGPKRSILVTGLGAGDSKGHNGWFYDRVIFPLVLAKSYVDKDRAEALLQKSNLDWTIVRPVHLTNGPKKNKIETLIGVNNYRYGDISRADVGTFILDCLEQNKFLKQAVGAADKK
ncbi:MAG TPA: SDR family oxidoreductase [Rhizomicrobium sp.]|jgi:putative NADH-flavin reductase|nr:SDR family oxidoreductase [Rhizomicrobium sp.]